MKSPFWGRRGELEWTELFQIGVMKLCSPEIQKGINLISMKPFLAAIVGPPFQPPNPSISKLGL